MPRQRKLPAVPTHVDEHGVIHYGLPPMEPPTPKSVLDTMQAKIIAKIVDLEWRIGAVYPGARPLNRLTDAEKIEALDLGLVPYTPQNETGMPLSERTIRNKWADANGMPRTTARFPQSDIGRYALDYLAKRFRTPRPHIPQLRFQVKFIDPDALNAARKVRDDAHAEQKRALPIPVSKRAVAEKPSKAAKPNKFAGMRHAALPVFPVVEDTPKTVMEKEMKKANRPYPAKLPYKEHAVSHVTSTFLAFHKRALLDTARYAPKLSDKLEAAGFVYPASLGFDALRCVGLDGVNELVLGEAVLDCSMDAVDQLVWGVMEEAPGLFTHDVFSAEALDVSEGEWNAVLVGKTLGTLPFHKVIWLLISLGLTPHLRITIAAPSGHSGNDVYVRVPGVPETHASNPSAEFTAQYGLKLAAANGSAV